jgi:Methyltransferase domain
MASTIRLLFNAVTFIPGATRLPPIRRVMRRHHHKTGGSTDARYCYSVWLRHLVSAANNGLNSAPQIVSELGPGDSLGMGLAAVLSGAERYYAFDVVAHASAERNMAVLDELIHLFQARTPIPDASEYPKISPTLNDYRFPDYVLTDERLNAALSPERIQRLKDSLRICNRSTSMVQYRAPWSTQEAVERDALDMVFSQATLEHVDQLQEVYEAMYLWLKPGGYMSHEIDFKSHGLAKQWNGHWAYSRPMWALVRGKDQWLINREPYSTHRKLAEHCGFRIVNEQLKKRQSQLRKHDLAPEFRGLTDDDLTTSSAFLQAIKPSGMEPSTQDVGQAAHNR